MRYEIHVPSTYLLKIKAAEQAVRTYHAEHLPDEPIEVAMDGQKFPSGENTNRPEQPFSIIGLTEVEKAARERVSQIETALVGRKSKQDVRRLIIAPESGLELDIKRLGIYDRTVTVAKDIDTGESAVGTSDGVRFPLWDVIVTAFSEGGFKTHTVGETFSKRMAKRGIKVDKQDPYVAMGHESRGVYLEQSARRALSKLPSRGAEN